MLFPREPKPRKISPPKPDSQDGPLFMPKIDSLILNLKMLPKGNSRTESRWLRVLGENLVLHELEQKGISAIAMGRKSKYGLMLGKSGKRVAVQTSLLKEEGIYPSGVRNYHWFVPREESGWPKYDFLACVALKKLNEPSFYIFTAKEALSIPEITHHGDGYLTRKIDLFESPEEYLIAKEKNPDYLCPFERYLNENRGEFLGKWEKLLV